MRLLIILSFIQTLVFCSCNGQSRPIRSTFIWQTQQYIGSEEFQRLDTLGINHLYVRYGDIRWNPYLKQAEPVDPDFDVYYPATGEHITAVIFITNDVMLHLENEGLNILAKKIAAMFKTIHEEYAQNNRASQKISLYDTPSGEYDEDAYKKALGEVKKNWLENNRELMIDCDWTMGSKDHYFEFLKLLKKELPGIKISSSLRLWQYRDYKTAGVPPVDRCMLMCYSTGDPSNPTEENAIFNMKTLQQFLNHDNYPTDVDIALPVYSWATLFRAGEFRGILSPMTIDNLTSNPSLFERKDSCLFIVRCDTVIGETYYRYGDELRFQGLETTTLISMAEWIKNHIKISSSTRIALFSYNPQYFNQLGNENIRKIYSIFD